MFAYVGMLVPAAKKAGIKVPPDPKEYVKYKATHPHFFVFVACQLGASMPYPGVHFDNAQIIASISEDKILTVTWQELVEAGFLVGARCD